MQVVYERCCGLDVHKRTVIACVLTPAGKQTRTFSTMTQDLIGLADWLVAQQVTHVAMESTGSFWKPVYNILETYDLELLVVNAQHIKAVPGRKTDVQDAAWIAELLRHGLLRGSHIPARDTRELQELVRYRTSLIRERTRVVQRLQKVLEGANIKLAAVATDVLGVSARAMLEALITGTEDPQQVARLAKGNLKKKQPALEAALQGAVGEHQRFLLQSQHRQLDFLAAEIATLSEEIERRLRPFAEALDRLDTISGVGRRVAEQVLVELGLDVERFPTHRHLASWAGLCPGNRESAGKRLGGKTRKGNPWLRSTLVEAAQAASRTRQTYLSAQYHRLAARRGRKRAIYGVAHTILVIAYHLLRSETTYRELGGNYFDERDKEAARRRRWPGRTLAVVGHAANNEEELAARQPAAHPY